MDLDKAQILLDKINRLYESMSADAGHIAGIETDLMRSYIRQFYEVFLQDDLSLKDKEPPPARDQSWESKPFSRPRESKKREEPLFEVVEPRRPEPEQPKKEEQPPPEAVKPKVETPEKRPEPMPKAKLTGKDYEALFAQDRVKELADKLGVAPIKDLTKAFSINDRIFNTNELFGGESDVFYNTIQVLNGMDSFDEAKLFLANNIANRYNWTSKEKKDIAKNFIKIIRRRFISA